MTSSSMYGSELDISDLNKSFGAVRALESVDLKFLAGELVGIIGPNGSGKSTLFDCCTGLTRSDSGRVRVDGKDITNWPMRRIALDARMVRSFQRNVVLGTMTIEENLVTAGQSREFGSVFGTFCSGASRRRIERKLFARADELISEVGLDPVRGKCASNISVGQQRLLQFAAGLMTDPRILLLDEPLAGVNPILIERLTKAIRWANQTLGMTIVIIEHNVDVITSLCQRLVVFNAGAIIAAGAPDQVTRDPAVREAYLGT